MKSHGLSEPSFKALLWRCTSEGMYREQTHVAGSEEEIEKKKNPRCYVEWWVCGEETSHLKKFWAVVHALAGWDTEISLQLWGSEGAASDPAKQSQSMNEVIRLITLTRV